MPRERAAILAALPAKGFALEAGGGHWVLRFRHQGLNTAIVTIVSHGSDFRQYSDDLLAKMSRALKVTRQQLNSLIDCDMDGPAYLSHLRSSGRIREPQPEQTPPKVARKKPGK